MAKEVFSKNSFWNNLFKTKTDKGELEEVLLAMPPFHDLSLTNLKSITKLMHQRIYHPNEMIFHQGDPGSGLYIIINGQVVIRQEEENKIWDLAKLSRGDFFGELALLDDELRSATAIALQETQVMVIFKPDLDAFIQNNPKDGIKILKGISQIIAVRLRSLNQDYFQMYKQMKKN
ncbi:MAG: cyclic nucleotide-binding domain-containing protein [Bacteroidota bacterium]